MQIERIRSNSGLAEGTAGSRMTSSREISAELGKSQSEATGVQREQVGPEIPREAKEDSQQCPTSNIGVDLKEQVEKLNKVALIFDKRINFEIHEETGRVMAKVVSKESGEILREIPPEQILNILAQMEDTLGLGILVDEQV